MRWNDPEPPKIGDHRTCSGFLWWPKKIWRETRWLENATWSQEYEHEQFYDGCNVVSYYKWTDLCWLEEDECIQD